MFKKAKQLVLLLFAVAMGLTGHAQTPADSTRVEETDTAAWSIQLDGVTVKAQQQLIKQEVDRIAYDVQADQDSKTQTVMDMLRKVPMVTVDGDDNILVKGNQSYKIYKNGHYDPMLSKNAKDVLKAIPASSIKRIEVITDPGAREDAEGVNAILNIVMMDNKHMQGMTGTVRASHQTTNYSSLGAYLAAQLGKAIVSVDYGYSNMTQKSTMNTHHKERTYVNTGNREISDSEGGNPGQVHFADINASLDIDTLNLLSASFGGYFYKMDVLGGGMTSMLDAGGTELYRFNEHYWMPSYSHHSWNGRMDYEHKMRRAGERLTLSYMLALTRQRTDYSEMVNFPFGYDGFLHNVRERFTEHTFQFDYVRPLWEGHKLEVGTKYIDRRNNSENSQRFYDDALTTTSDAFGHTMQIAAAYADQVSVEYCDGNMQQLGLMAIVRGEQASGKSVCKMAVDLWKRLMDAEDAVSRKREEAWREQKKNRKANEKAPDDPHVLIRVVPVTVSCSTLLKRLKNAQGHTLFSFGEELDTLRKTNGAGSWSSKYDIYRLSFDHGEWGQDYNSDMAESGMVNVAYNWTMLGTNGALRKCFRSDNIENGLSSRVLVAEMPDASFQKMPKFHKRSAAEEGRISQAAELLRRWQGVVNVPRLRRTSEQWVEE